MLVLQEWVNQVGLKMQSILLSGFRAPDQHTVAVKKCVRWLRAKCQINADPSKGSYMKQIEMSHELIDAAMDECEYLPVHYVHHLADAFRILALFHPDQEVQELAYYLHEQVAVELFHFVPETDAEFLYRHRDKVNSKPAEGEVAVCQSCTGKHELVTCVGCGASVCRRCFYVKGCKLCGE